MAMAVARPAGATGRQHRTTSGRPASGRPAPGHVLRTRPLLKSVIITPTCFNVLPTPPRLQPLLQSSNYLNFDLFSNLSCGDLVSILTRVSCA